MAKIEIDTTQKVAIQYETAGFGWRLLASVIDRFLIWLVYFLLFMFVFPNDMFDKLNLVNFLIYAVLIIVYISFPLVIEIFTNGQSIGKKLLKIKVIKLNGNALDMNDYFTRWIYRFIDFMFSLGTIGVISIILSEKQQRLGDMIANTTVVKLTPERIVTIDDLENLPVKEEYEPKYPLVIRYNDDEMLVLKNLLLRHQKYNSAIYSNLIAENAKKIKEQLEVENTTIDDASFIRDVINEYVILTR
ncbi:MAG: RDD family protein [Chitinophagales bacterium]